MAAALGVSAKLSKVLTVATPGVLLSTGRNSVKSPSPWLLTNRICRLPGAAGEAVAPPSMSSAVIANVMATSSRRRIQDLPGRLGRHPLRSLWLCLVPVAGRIGPGDEEQLDGQARVKRRPPSRGPL